MEYSSRVTRSCATAKYHLAHSFHQASRPLRRLIRLECSAHPINQEVPLKEIIESVIWMLALAGTLCAIFLGGCAELIRWLLRRPKRRVPTRNGGVANTPKPHTDVERGAPLETVSAAKAEANKSTAHHRGRCLLG